MAPNPTQGWEKLQDVFYRKRTLYELKWETFDVDIDDYKMVGAPFGGALAVYRDPAKPVAYRGPASRERSIMIFNSAGDLLTNIPWTDGSIKGIGWTETEQLVVVTENGLVQIFAGFEATPASFSLGKDAETNGVVDCQFWSTGLVARLSNNRLVAVSRLDEPRPRLLAELAVTPAEIHGWALVPPTYTLSRHVEVLLGVNSTVVVNDTAESQDQYLEEGPFTHIAVSPNGLFVLLYTSYGRVWVVSVDFQKKYSEYDTGTTAVPSSVVWCGNDCAVIAWEDEVRLVGPGGQVLSFFYAGRVFLVPEIDGVRVISSDRCEFIAKVPDVTVDAFRIGSTAPSAILLDAAEHLLNKSPKADDNIQIIRPKLSEAVDACIRAAGYEPEPYWQKRLLQAARFGKSVLELYTSDDYVDMCEVLFVLQEVRKPGVGLPLTYDQFIRLTPERLLERLMSRRKHLLALRIATYLLLPTDKIYVHWACAKVKYSTEDDKTTLDAVVAKLGAVRGISYEEVARTAYNEGRTGLATKLLDYEPRAGRQVPLLLSMEEDEIALVKAVDSGDPDLVYYVLLHLKKKLPLAQFFRLVNEKPTATAMVEELARLEGPELLKDFYYQDDRRSDGANVILREALKLDDPAEKSEKLKLASKLHTSSKELYSNSRAMEDAARLLDAQIKLEKDLQPDQPLAGLSVSDTIVRLFKMGQGSKAMKIKNDFKVPDKRFQTLKTEKQDLRDRSA
ncbi:Vps16, N-terminal region-domain-containing protein [Dipodascopsis tothii]|uniref:Vps16, N-terminal region-domain-containing protein n=1 Tax=Dipodascopsis tothii TaxID=44089 RepID=UPI0034CD912B